MANRKEQLAKAKKAAQLLNRIAEEESAPRVVGSVEIFTKRPDEDWVCVHEEHNLVVSQAENLMAHMAAGTSNAEIGEIRLGDPATASTPDLADTALDQHVAAADKSVTASVTDGTVTFTASYAVGDAVQVDPYTEAGLFTAAGSMFARKAGFSIVKTGSIEMRFVWTLRFSVSAQSGSQCSGASLYPAATVTQDYVYTATGSETYVVVPFDFTPTAKHLDVFLNGQRLVYTDDYIESTNADGSGNKGIIFQGGLTLTTSPSADVVYFVLRRSV